MLGFLVFMVSGLAIAVAAAAILEAMRLRRPPRRTYAWAVSRGLPPDPGEAVPARRFTAFTFNGPSGAAYPAWEIAGEDPAGPVVIATPGWGDSRLGIIPRLIGLAPRASKVFVWDPPGLGEAPGRCNLGTRRDVEALLALIEAVGPSTSPRPKTQVEDPPWRDPSLVLYGWSLGAGVSIAAAVANQDRGVEGCAVIAEAPYRLPWTPARNVLRLAGLPHVVTIPIIYPLLGIRLGVGAMWRGFDRAILAARLRCPLLVVHGTADEVCPIEDGRAIASAAPKGRLATIEGATHNTLWTAEPWSKQCAREVSAFMALSCSTRPSARAEGACPSIAPA